MLSFSCNLENEKKNTCFCTIDFGFSINDDQFLKREEGKSIYEEKFEKQQE